MRREGEALSAKRKEAIQDFTKTQKSKNSDLGLPLQQQKAMDTPLICSNKIMIPIGTYDNLMIVKYSKLCTFIYIIYILLGKKTKEGRQQPPSSTRK